MILTGWLAKKAVTKTIQIIIIIVLVMASVWGIHYTGVTAERSRLQPIIAEKDRQIISLVTTVEKNSSSTQGMMTTLEEIYKQQLTGMEGAYGLEIKNLNILLTNYESQRLRDKNNLHSAEGRISSLSEAASQFAETDKRARVLSERLEQLERGVHNRLVVPAEQDLARLKLAKKYIDAARKLKEKYDELRKKFPVAPMTNP